MHVQENRGLGATRNLVGVCGRGKEAAEHEIDSSSDGRESWAHQTPTSWYVRKRGGCDARGGGGITGLERGMRWFVDSGRKKINPSLNLIDASTLSVMEELDKKKKEPT